MLAEVYTFFQDLEHQKKSSGAYNHKKLITAIKKNNALFDNDDHHDAHEFVTWLLDQIHEQVQKEDKGSFVKDLFGGKIQSTFTCLCCESFSKRSEDFYNLSLDLEKNSSLNYCIQRFSCKELLNKSNKLHCDTCLTKQVGTKEI